MVSLPAKYPYLNKGSLALWVTSALEALELAVLHRQQAALAQQMVDADAVISLRRGDGWSLAAAGRVSVT